MFLSGKRALVTGSTSGIGLAIARALRAAGAELVVNGFGDQAEIERIRGELEAGYSGADLSTAEGVAQLMEEAGEIDSLVHNVGVQHVPPVEEFPLEQWAQKTGRAAGREK